VGDPRALRRLSSDNYSSKANQKIFVPQVKHFKKVFQERLFFSKVVVENFFELVPTENHHVTAQEQRALQIKYEKYAKEHFEYLIKAFPVGVFNDCLMEKDTSFCEWTESNEEPSTCTVV